MKKSLLALAVLGAFAGTAAAQSSVTIYGVVDLGIVKGNGGTAALPIPGSNLYGSSPNVAGAPANQNQGNAGANGSSKAWQEKSATASRLGFRGNEDLGGGLSAQFQIEHRFTPDDGASASASTFWEGRSYVQLTSAAAGSVYLGREYGPAFWVANKSDPFGWDGVGQMGALQYGGFNDTNGLNRARTANTVGYKTPNLGGLTANLAVGLSEGPTAGRNQGFNVEYGAGPLYAGVAFEKISNGTVADGNSLLNLAVHYDLGFVKPILYYARSKTNFGNDTNKVLQLAATAPVGPGTLKAAWLRLKNDAGQKGDKFGLGYNYPLSKRTNLYADVGSFDTDISGQTRNTAYNFGVRHNF